MGKVPEESIRSPVSFQVDFYFRTECYYVLLKNCVLQGRWKAF